MKINIELDVAFYSYGKEIDKKIQRQIVRWVKETLKNDLSYIPIFPEDGIEDSTRKIKIKVAIQ